MTEDTHARANAEQVQVLREALGGVEAAGGETADTAAEEVCGLDPLVPEGVPALP